MEVCVLWQVLRKVSAVFRKNARELCDGRASGRCKSGRLTSQYFAWKAPATNLDLVTCHWIFVAIHSANFLLDIKTIKPIVREWALAIIEKHIRDECAAAGTPQPPIIKFSTRAPLTEDDQSVAGAVGQVFGAYYGDRAVEMKFTRACEDFATLGAIHKVPYTYWNYGGHDDLEEGTGPTNHSTFFVLAIQPTLQAGTDAMAPAALTFLAKQ